MTKYKRIRLVSTCQMKFIKYVLKQIMQSLNKNKEQNIITLTQTMQQLATHFNSKKTQYINFFSNIIRIIQRVSNDIQLQTDSQFDQAIAQFQNCPSQLIRDTCRKMEQDRHSFYRKIIDSLYLYMKNYLNAYLSQQQVKKKHQNQMLSKRTDVQPSKGTSKKVEDNINQKQNVIIHSNSTIQEKNQRQHNSKIKQTQTFNSLTCQTSKKVISQYDQKMAYNSKNNRSHPNTFQNIQIHNHKNHHKVQSPSLKKKSVQSHQQICFTHVPTAFSQKKGKIQPIRGGAEELNQKQDKSNRKIEVLKKNDVCLSLDNYIKKQARQMLQKNQSRSKFSNPYQSLKKSNTFTKTYRTPDTAVMKNEQLNNYQKNIQQKLGNTYKGNQNSKGLTGAIISPIQRFKI